MMSKLKEALQIIDKLDYPTLLDYSPEYYWLRVGNYLYYAESLEELEEQSGNYYEQYLPEGYIVKDELFITNIDCDTGTLLTLVLDMNKQIEITNSWK